MRLRPPLTNYIPRPLLVGTVLWGALAGICAVPMAWQLSKGLHGVFLAGQNRSFLGKALLWLILFALLRALFSALQGQWASKLSSRAKSKIRQVLLTSHQLEPLPLLRGVEALDAWYSQYLPQLFLAVLVPLLILCAVFWADPLSAAILFLSAPLLPLFLGLIGMSARAKQRNQWKLLLQQGVLYQETLLGLKTLKLFDRHKDWGSQLAHSASVLREATLAVLRIAFLSALVLELVGTLGTAIIAVEVGLRLLHGAMDYQRALFVLLLAPEFYLPLRLLGLRAHAAMEGDTAAQTLLAPGTPIIPAPIRTAPQTSAILQVTNCSARWPTQLQPAFTSLSFALQPGEFLGIEGPSGCGKSTLLQVILGLLPPEQGFIHQKPGLRILWVPQHPRIYHRSLRDNLLQIPESDSSRDPELLRALERVGLGGFVRNLPQGLDTSAAEGGMRLSGGQARRLALARAFLDPCDLILFDEPDAHLDQESMVVLEDLVCHLDHIARIVISHRPQTLQKAHRILHMGLPC